MRLPWAAPPFLAGVWLPSSWTLEQSRWAPISRNTLCHTAYHEPSLRQALKRAYKPCQVRDAPVKNCLTGNKRH